MDKNKLAERIYSLSSPDVVRFDIFILAALISMISAVISMLKNLGYLDSEMQSKLSRPNWLMRFRLRRLAHQHIKDADLADTVAIMLPVASSELNPASFAAVFQENG